MSVRSDPAEAVQAVVDVATLSALAALAERFDVGVLDYDGEDGEHVYFAVIGDIVYRYQTVPEPRRVDAAVIPFFADDTTEIPRQSGFTRP